MPNVITLTPENSEQLPARLRMSASERRERGPERVWTNDLTIAFKSFWRGNTTRVSLVEDKPKPKPTPQTEQYIGLPRHLAKRAPHERHVIVSGNQPAIPIPPPKPAVKTEVKAETKPVVKAETKAERNARKSTARAVRQARERGIL